VSGPNMRSGLSLAEASGRRQRRYQGEKARAKLLAAREAMVVEAAMAWLDTDPNDAIGETAEEALAEACKLLKDARRGLARGKKHEAP